MDRNALLLELVSDALRTTRGTPEHRLPTPLVRLDRLSLSIIDAGLAEEALALAASILDQDRYQDRVYLSNLAERLMLQPVVVRQILADAEHAGELAA